MDNQTDVTRPQIASAPGWPLVLYFHHIDDKLEHYTSITCEEFQRALHILSETYIPLSPRSIPEVLKQKRDWSDHCLITFDDGYRDNYKNALPILRNFDWSVIFFVIVDTIGKTSHHDFLGDLDHMNWRELRRLADEGHVIASHGSAHKPYAEATPEWALKDIRCAARRLSKRIPEAPDWFAYPFGSIPKFELDLPSLCFGTVRSPAKSWIEAPKSIRRTYLPSNRANDWADLVKSWRTQ